MASQVFIEDLAGLPEDAPTLADSRPAILRWRTGPGNSGIVPPARALPRPAAKAGPDTYLDRFVRGLGRLLQPPASGMLAGLPSVAIPTAYATATAGNAAFALPALTPAAPAVAAPARVTVGPDGEPGAVVEVVDSLPADVPWLDQQLIPGLKNLYLVALVGGLVVLRAMRRR